MQLIDKEKTIQSAKEHYFDNPSMIRGVEVCVNAQEVINPQEEIMELAKFHSIKLPVVYGDGTQQIERYIDLIELGVILSEIFDNEQED